MNCPFCQIDKEKIIYENSKAFAIYDKYPVNQGHILIISKKHIVDYFNCPDELKDKLWSLLEKSKEVLDEKFNPDGYNIGINCGEVAGQTINHLHIHLIPRYRGDIEDPTGGVRGVIPDERVYHNNRI